ncbi:hypothetical protein [Cellulomonas fimi]|uniref:Transcriptional regulator HTH-type FeoC domain-containing protein n=1 Tax=Cellulomonas fimi (strain ATCC 484 / DSM 20113 / JCM 1341 / CCUG 24087 / LMG 16345 / NBRC 15513 / NCIMB 8980 / NCTC 7547 / NRS-133) TaxID=590998 RepID=F4H2R8_CELFA|nr:hypothetical protein [Cellulomonas fimi]AEE46417.1 hypothetical protein Celf_2290 [Cellulomonas fimi ATCC 484]NNH08707.1 hypothetical protein [Cellulomonas fimi]VEH32913.1 Uncharacterised protein [Cellulomonas fimi]
MSTFADVLRETDRGLRPAVVAARLGLSLDVVTAALDHAAAVGLVVRPAGGCSTCAPAPVRPVGCAGCPFATGG